MKKKLGWFLVLSVLAGFILFMVVPKRTILNIYRYAKGARFEKRSTEPVLALLDWDTKQLKINSDSFQYFNFRISDSGYELPDGIEKLDSERPTFVSVDMWNNFLVENPLESIVKGNYDSKIIEMCKLFSKERSPIFIRWNPEMEVPAKIYPWQNQSPKVYNEAFRYFSTLCKKWLPGAKIVWSTAGYPGVLEYYPGDEVIDYVSVTLQSKSEKSTKAFPDYKSVAEEIERKIHRMRFISKPVLVLGESKTGNKDSVLTGINEAARYISKHSEIIYQTAVLNAKPSMVGRRDGHLKIGVYDPKEQLNQLKEVSTEHIFPNWRDLQDGSFEKHFNAIIARNHDVIVTMEPWREVNAKPDSNLLESVVDGRYDHLLNKLFNTISKADRTVYLRWIHEMEIPVTRYPWQSQPPVNYIKAYRYFASFRKPENTNIKLVWGPAGDRGLQDFWPGNDVVDVISMAIYGLPDKNITDHKKQESFYSIYDRKAYRMRLFDKPIFVTEFGIKGPEDYQLEWLLAASKTINSTQQIMGVSYFNMVDTPKAWGDIEAPDWSISKETFIKFVNSLVLNVQDKSIATN